MTMTNIPFLRCNDCGATFDRHDGESTNGARKRAKQAGWVAKQWAASRLWFCPEHSFETARAFQSEKGDQAPVFIAQWERFITAPYMLLFHPYAAEYHFDPDNPNVRADMFFLLDKLAIEINGGRFAVGGGAHNTDQAFTRDNRYAVLGIRLLRFSPQMVNNDPLGCIRVVLLALGLNPNEYIE